MVAALNPAEGVADLAGGLALAAVVVVVVERALALADAGGGELRGPPLAATETLSWMLALGVTVVRATWERNGIIA
jgi:hypothetical protein